MARNTCNDRSDYWRQLLTDHARSGLSLRAFAARADVSVNTLAYWKYKRQLAEQAPTLVPVTLIDADGSNDRALVVELCGAKLHVPAGFDLAVVAGVIEILRRPC